MTRCMICEHNDTLYTLATTYDKYTLNAIDSVRAYLDKTIPVKVMSGNTLLIHELMHKLEPTFDEVTYVGVDTCANLQELEDLVNTLLVAYTNKNKLLVLDDYYALNQRFGFTLTPKQLARYEVALVLINPPSVRFSDTECNVHWLYEGEMRVNLHKR